VGEAVTMRAMLIASLMSTVAALGSLALAQTMTCITSSQGYRICDDGHGHSTTEWHWQGMTFTKQTDDPYDLIAHPPTGAREDHR
jgi:hypothetical protein